MIITGKTKLIAHLGVPTETFKAPMIYNPYFAKYGIDAVVVPMGSKPEDYPAFLRLAFKLTNIHGALITMPHKVTTIGLVDRLSTTAKVAGALNAVRLEEDGKLIGDMFDGEGFVRGMERKGRSAGNASALIIGTGGVGSAIAASLAKAGLARMMLFDPNAKSAQALAVRLKQHYPALDVMTGSTDPTGVDIVVNASPLGMNPDDPLPVDTSKLSPHQFAGEVVLKQAITPFLAAAQAKGCTIQIGIDMLYEQIPAYLEFFGFRTTTPDELRAVAQVSY
jgi:shikimate dehydrogenase